MITVGYVLNGYSGLHKLHQVPYAYGGLLTVTSGYI